jgi:rhodanese-related sulfurtransferase
MKYKLLTLISFIVFSTSCQTTQKDSNIEVINSEKLKTLIKNDGVQFVDVRTMAEFKENNIQGAENIVFDENFASKLDKFDKDKPIVIYCRSGRRSAASAKILDKNGFSKIYDLDGGILKWIEEGNELN